MSRPAPARAVAEIRRRRPEFADLPDEAVANLAITHYAETRLALRDLGLAIRGALPARIRRALGDNE